MEVKRARLKIHPAGGANAIITFQDRKEKAVLDLEVHKQLERGFGVYLGPAFEDEMQVVVPEQAGFTGTTLRGYTRDATIAEIARRFAAATDSDDLKPDGFILYPQDGD